MAQKQIRDVALVSIHPEFVERILDGRKTVEFRKVCFKRDISHLVIYATTPISSIVAYCEVKGFKKDAPLTLWEEYHAVSGISEEGFFRYYNGYAQGFAIEIGQLIKLPSPLKISRLSFSINPPQSYLYMASEQFNEIRDFATGSLRSVSL